MSTALHKPEVFRHAYQAPAFAIESVALRFELDFLSTTVHARLQIKRLDAAQADCFLHGEELELRSIAIDGVALDPSLYTQSETGLTLFQVPDVFTLETTVAIQPSGNTRLEGLYRSGDFILTQCEAEGFRRITFFLDRPDVMSVFSVSLIANPKQFPVLLANGNPLNEITLPDGRVESRWFDPHPKPSYLFAIAAGQLEFIEDWFLTRAQRNVRIRIYSQPDAITRCHFALGAVKRAMAWDEQRFGLSYDLDVFNIVATHDFNMGAMENKGLNIFNAKYIVADENTATDSDFEHVEAVIGHEYFHNWTGNRVTCRDWFQLSLKEGLTVFRDQEFTADLHSRGIKRIDDVRALRANQFPEDSGPFAHPVRPESYVEINNFYTMTVYEKGAEVVRMVQTLLGIDGFRKGMDLYFKRHDGQAVTCDDFRAAVADANGVNLDQFERWYLQAGTPNLHVRTKYDSTQKRFLIHAKQDTPATPNQNTKLPQVIPIQYGLYDQSGAAIELPDGKSQGLWVLSESEATLSIENVAQAPVLSILQNFSAPVNLHFAQTREDLALLARCDIDPFNRWEAMQRLAQQAVVLRYHADNEIKQAEAALWQKAWQEAALITVKVDSLDAALAAELLSVPDFVYLAEMIPAVDPQRLLDGIQAVEAGLIDSHGKAIAQRLAVLNASMGDGATAAKRRLRNRLLFLLQRHAPERAGDLAAQQFERADNMTDRGAALTALVHTNAPQAQTALQHFYRTHQSDALVLDKWFAIQASAPATNALTQVQALLRDPAFSLHNPNKVRALIGTFARQNPKHFHAIDGSGYAFVSEHVATLDATNPQIAARLVAVFNGWRKLEPIRAGLMQTQLQWLSTKVQSPDVKEIVMRALAD